MKAKLNHLISSFCLIATLVATGCSDEHEYTSGHSYYDDVKLEINQVDKNNVLSVKLADETYPLSVAVTPGALSFNPVSYVYGVGDNSIATVDKNGKLTLLKPGETTLSVKYRGNKAISTDCTLKVVASLIRDVIVNSEIVMGTDEPLDLAEYITLMPWSADARALSYTVKPEYEGIVQMVEGSTVKALSVGDAVIEVRSTDGLNVVKELKLKVTGSTPVSEIRLNDKAGEINGQTLSGGLEFDLSSCITILPEDAADKRLKYEVVSGSECVSLTEAGILTTVAGGNVVIKISPVDEVSNPGVAPCMFAFEVNAWNDRSVWKVSTSIQYSDGNNYVKDGNTGKPEDILDDDTATFLSLVKPGKTYGSWKADAIDVPLYFVIDMGMKQSFNYFTWAHRSTISSNYLRVWGISMYGSNDGTNFTKIQSDIDIPYENNTDKIEIDIPESAYRYIKVQLIKWSDIAGGSTLGGTMQIGEFNVGKK